MLMVGYLHDVRIIGSITALFLLGIAMLSLEWVIRVSCGVERVIRVSYVVEWVIRVSCGVEHVIRVVAQILC